jgi:hypothetical protein
MLRQIGDILHQFVTIFETDTACNRLSGICTKYFSCYINFDHSMPFTFSHPALILPLRYLPRSWFSFTGLIIGSIVPDLEYIIHDTRTFSHTYSGILWFNLPLALLLAFVFHNILRDKIISRLPAFMYSRFARFEGFNWNLYFKKNKGIVITSIILGIATHLFWDSFTNISGYFVIKFPVFREVIDVAGIPLPFYILLWTVSSIAGLLVLVIAVYLLPQGCIKSKYSNVAFLIIFMLVAVLIFCLLLFSWWYENSESVIMIFLRSGLLFLLLIAILSKKKRDSNKL